MDTRSKILTADQARARAEGQPVKAVIGYFDVLQAGHIRRLRELKQDGCLLAAVILDPPEPLLNRQARMELAAALDIIDFVIPRDALEDLPSAEIVHEEQQDAQRTAELIAHVTRRYR